MGEGAFEGGAPGSDIFGRRIASGGLGRDTLRSARQGARSRSGAAPRVQTAPPRPPPPPRSRPQAGPRRRGPAPWGRSDLPGSGACQPSVPSGMPPPEAPPAGPALPRFGSANARKRSSQSGGRAFGRHRLDAALQRRECDAGPGRLAGTQQIATLRRRRHARDEPKELRGLVVERSLDPRRFAHRPLDAGAELRGALRGTGRAGPFAAEPGRRHTAKRAHGAQAGAGLPRPARRAPRSPRLTLTACAASEW